MATIMDTLDYFDSIIDVVVGKHMHKSDQIRYLLLGAAQQQYIENQAGPLASSGLTQFVYLPTMNFKEDKQALSKILKRLENNTGSHPLEAVRAQHLSNLLAEGQKELRSTSFSSASIRKQVEIRRKDSV